VKKLVADCTYDVVSIGYPGLRALQEAPPPTSEPRCPHCTRRSRSARTWKPPRAWAALTTPNVYFCLGTAKIDRAIACDLREHPCVRAALLCLSSGTQEARPELETSRDPFEVTDLIPGSLFAAIAAATPLPQSRLPRARFSRSARPTASAFGIINRISPMRAQIKHVAMFFGQESLSPPLSKQGRRNQNRWQRASLTSLAQSDPLLQRRCWRE